MDGIDETRPAGGGPCYGGLLRLRRGAQDRRQRRSAGVATATGAVWRRGQARVFGIRRAETQGGEAHRSW